MQFAHYLALELGIADVQGMLRDMTYTQFCAWMSIYRAQPWGVVRSDLQAGVVASAVYNVNRSKKSSKVWGPNDFILFKPDQDSLDSDGNQRHTKRASEGVDLNTEAGWGMFKTYIEAVATTSTSSAKPKD